MPARHVRSFKTTSKHSAVVVSKYLKIYLLEIQTCVFQQEQGLPELNPKLDRILHFLLSQHR